MFTAGFHDWSGEKVVKELHPLCWQPVLLHDGGTDLWSLLQVWGHQEGRHGAGQGQEDALWILLHRVSFHLKTYVSESAAQRLAFLMMTLYPPISFRTCAILLNANRVSSTGKQTRLGVQGKSEATVRIFKLCVCLLDPLNPHSAI